MSSGTGRIFKRGNIYWIDYSHRGERHRESSGSTRKKDARALLKERMGECANGGPRVDEEDLTFSDLKDVVVADYKLDDKRSLDRLQNAFDHLEAYFGGWHLVDIGAADVQSYKLRRKDDEGAAKATINKELSALRRGFNLLAEQEKLSRTPKVKTFSTDNARRVFIPYGDVEAIAEEISDDLAPVVWFAFYTGWRKGEIIAFDGSDGLQWEQVDFDAGEVWLDPDQSKNEEGRVFPFNAVPEVGDLLKRQRERNKLQGLSVPHVFHRNGKPIKSMRGAWNGACKRAGFVGGEGGYIFHDLRRTAARNLIRAGVPKKLAKKFTGHKTDSVFDRYSISDPAMREQFGGQYSEYLSSLSESDDQSAESLEQVRGA